jgi:hypothetical protein
MITRTSSTPNGRAEEGNAERRSAMVPLLLVQGRGARARGSRCTPPGSVCTIPRRKPNRRPACPATPLGGDHAARRKPSRLALQGLSDGSEAMSNAPEACRSDAPRQVSRTYRPPERRERLETGAKPPKLDRGKASGAFDMPLKRPTRSRCRREPGWPPRSPEAASTRGA